MKNKRNSKHNGGFTLVELVVILVILAILASLMIPALTGYIEKAKDNALIACCRSCVVAAQSLLSESYAKDEINFTLDESKTAAFAEVKGTVSDTDYDPSAVLRHLSYTEGEKTAVYCSKSGCSVCGNNEKYTVVDGRNNQRRLNEAMLAVAAKFNELRSGGVVQTDNLDSVNLNTSTGPNITALFNQLTPAQQSFLKEVTWSVRRTNGTMTLYFTAENYGTQSATNIRVYKYNMKTGQYAHADNGTAIESGKVSVSASDWSSYEDTIPIIK